MVLNQAKKSNMTKTFRRCGEVQRDKPRQRNANLSRSDIGATAGKGARARRHFGTLEMGRERRHIQRQAETGDTYRDRERQGTVGQRQVTHTETETGDTYRDR